jgi:ribosome-associated toxin RatA of RatAB toxin-antitoxin module
MHTVSRSRWMPYTPESIYAALTAPEKLAQIVKRIDSIQVLERQGDYGKVLARIDLPGGKMIETVGTVEGEVGKSLIFTTTEPFPLSNLWEFEVRSQDGAPGTYVTNTLQLDLSPVAAFVSGLVLTGYLSAELDGDLERLEEMVANETTPA